MQYMLTVSVTFQDRFNTVAGPVIHLCILTANIYTVTTCDTSFMNNFGLSIYNLDSFNRTFPDTGIANLTKVFHRINKRIIIL